jgi:hypothetical protein
MSRITQPPSPPPPSLPPPSPHAPFLPLNACLANVQVNRQFNELIRTGYSTKVCLCAPASCPAVYNAINQPTRTRDALQQPVPVFDNVAALDLRFCGVRFWGSSVYTDNVVGVMDTRTQTPYPHARKVQVCLRLMIRKEPWRGRAHAQHSAAAGFNERRDGDGGC